jgi:alpha-L-rhamnosidase
MLNKINAVMATQTHRLHLLVLLPALSTLVSFGVGATGLTPTHLRCEYEVNPLGIDEARPRLFWQLEGSARGQTQTAYQVLVASSEAELRRGVGDLWDSGKVDSEQSVFVPYSGTALTSRQACHWRVRVWDKDGKRSAWSAPAMWTMGILRADDWKGQWIASDLELKDYQKTLRDLPDFGMEPEREIWGMADKCRQMSATAKEAPAVWLRKEFEAPGRIRRATASICGLGFYELYLNGARVGNHYLDPAYTDYQKRALYVTYDVTRALRKGHNAIGVVLGNGWFNLITPHVLRYYAADYIAPPRLRMDFDIEFTDGTHRRIGTDTTWKFTTDGPIRFNCVLAGETYDARREMPGWDRAGFDDSKWKPALPAAAPEGRLVAQRLPPVRKVKAIAAVSVAKHGEGYRFDLGVETVGWARLRAKGRPGQEITISYPGSGSHTLGRYQTCKYVFKGQGVETFEPRFCYNGFRYVDVTGLSAPPSARDLVGQMVCTDLEPAGEFACSDEDLTRLQQILLRTVRNYIVHIPNDPTREKAGWSQDVESGFFETVYNFNAALVYRKWQRDFLDIIHTNGYVPPVVPGRFDGPGINGPWWGGAIIYGPWYMYQFYGDRDILAESYPAMQKQFEYLGTLATNNIIRWGLGDWMEVGSVRPKATPVRLTSTCAYFWFARILSQTAELLGRPDDARRYAGLAVEIRDAYNREFLNPETGQYASGSQAAQLVSLYYGLAPDDKRELVLRRLVERIAQDKDHLSTGFVATPILLTGLAEMGRADVAWRIGTQPTFPSFIDAVLHRGNTVMKENWDGGLVQMPSLQGPVGTWFYHSLAGIRSDPSGPGFQRIILKPETAEGLSWVKAWHDCLYGRIISQWKREHGKLSFEFTIPPNTTATVYIPTSSASDVTESGRPASASPGVKFLRQENGAAIFALGSGSYHFAN